MTDDTADSVKTLRCFVIRTPVLAVQSFSFKLILLFEFTNGLKNIFAKSLDVFNDVFSSSVGLFKIFPVINISRLVFTFRLIITILFNSSIL